MSEIIIPPDFEKKFPSNSEFSFRLRNLCASVEKFISVDKPQDRQPFFKDYTDHGFSHINKVLENAVSLIPIKTLKILNPHEIFYLVSAIIIHDIGMHISPEVFFSLINGSNDILLQENSILDGNKSWESLYKDFLRELKKYSAEKKIELFGNADEKIKDPVIAFHWEPKPVEARIVGEFLRKHHHRYCQEVALLGFYNPTRMQNVPLFGESSNLRKEDLQIIGILARSHNAGLNDLDIFLLSKFNDKDRLPNKVQIKYLMAILRLADYMEIDCERCGLNPYRYIPSKRSLLEHIKHDLVNGLEQFPEEKRLHIHVTDCEDKEVEDQVYFELKKLINGLQIEFNNCNHAISAMNTLIEETRYQVTFNEVSCNKVNYRDLSNELKRVKPYKYSDYLIEEYLTQAIEKYKDVNFSYKDETFENKDAELIQLFYPLTFKRIQGNLPTAITHQGRKDFNSAIEANNVKTSIYTEVLNTSNQGVGFISPAGYGKTILSKALFCFFAYRSLGQETKEVFWKELNELKEFDFVPLLFTCNPQRTTKFFNSISQLIKESLIQLEIDPTHPLHESLLKELLFLYHQKKIKLLIIIDAIDELEENEENAFGNSTHQFMNFINEHLLTNKTHAVIFTKRESFRTDLKEQTIRYEIEELQYQQQAQIVSNLCKIRKIDEEKIKHYIETLTGDKLSQHLKGCPLTLTNSFFYYLHQQVLPDADTLEKVMIPIFFMRKKEVCTREMEELLTKIALRIRELKKNNCIQEVELFDLVERFYKQNSFIQKVKAQSEVINWLCQKIGILIRKVNLDGNNIKVITYQFHEFKYLENLLDNYDTEKISTEEEMKLLISTSNIRELNPDYPNQKSFEEKDKVKHARMIKNYSSNNKNTWKYE